MNDGNTLKPGYVEIQGRLYKTIAKRVQEFWDEHDHAHWGIVTTILENSDERVRFKAEVVCNYSTGSVVVGTGHAEETREGYINKISAVENCETSAIGRALAAVGYGGSSLEYASAEEMLRAEKARQIEEDGKMSPQQMRKYVEAMNKAVADNDGPGLMQGWDELNTAQQLWLWDKLRSYERRAIKDLLAKAREDANKPDPQYIDPETGSSQKDARRAAVKK